MIYNKLRPITKEDINKIDDIRKSVNHVTSSHTAASIAAWAGEMGLRIILEDYFFCVNIGKLDGNHWFFPCGERKAIGDFIRNLICESEEKVIFHYMRKTDTEFLNEEFSGIFTITEAADDSEYILSRAGQLDLSGKKSKYMRNQVNQSLRDYDITVKLLDNESKGDLLKHVGNWMDHKDNDAWLGNELLTEYMLENISELNGLGLIFYVSDELFGLTAGYPISDDMFDFAIIKQKYILGGMGTFMKYRFVQELPEQYEYINIEENLGIPGLQNMKSRLHPVSMIDMYMGVEK